MRLVKLTRVGYSLASNPTHQVTPGMKALYYMRKNGYVATDEQLKDVLGDKYSEAIRNITTGEAPAAYFVRVA